MGLLVIVGCGRSPIKGEEIGHNFSEESSSTITLINDESEAIDIRRNALQRLAESILSKGYNLWELRELLLTIRFTNPNDVGVITNFTGVSPFGDHHALSQTMIHARFRWDRESDEFDNLYILVEGIIHEKGNNLFDSLRDEPRERLQRMAILNAAVIPSR
jgi:hypothetical protein